MTRVIGCDISTWQDSSYTPQRVNFEKMRDNGARFVFIKASQLQADDDFAYNWQASKAAGLLRGAYHYLDWRKSELDQARMFIDLWKSDPGELPPVCDFEMTTYMPPKEQMRGRLWNFLTKIEREIGIFPILYTGFYHWNTYGSKDAAWARYPLWLPWYSAEWYVKLRSGTDGSPKPWKAWTFWQYTDRGDGLAYGVESKQIDLNVFNGTEDELRAWAGLEGGIIAPPPVVQIGYRLTANVQNSIIIRADPNGAAQIVGYLYRKDEPIYITENLSGGYVKLASGRGWVWANYLERM
jgi:lysozyme